MDIRVADVMREMERIAPKQLALEHDRIGLQLGDPNAVVERLWVGLEVTPELVTQAIAAGVDMLVTHHAPLYRPLTHIDWSQPRQRAIAELVAHRISVFAAHTNLDVAPGGVNDVIAKRLELLDPQPLDITYRTPLKKLVVYTPKESVESVRQTIGDAGAGCIGNYSHCTFAAPGTGSFVPGDGTHPYVGEVGKLELVSEVRLETVVPAYRLADVVSAMLRVHPYEEVAYDIYDLDIPGAAFGIGRIGQLSVRETLAEFADRARIAFGLPHVRYAGDPGRIVKTAAVLGGSGSGWIGKALAAGADVMVTADVSHHQAADAVHDGMAVIDVPHAALEAPVCEVVAKQLQAALGNGVVVETVPVGVDPWRWL
ncbi:dinuclear metal center YbgI/SA1388 family protein [Alicyclobacillus sacchari]|uniref:GTP cyclohydrolase 1 type 2 homolog n=1 Tax=Alicyclobacillus sacchari TaxID=392010 RepID=A0A4R8LNX3_9BACL|nr:Nif3-like dinuclear metal center hexameric protein [Alicyclobacillus sacchari]TDY47998.1 dinuclear metal center YbgI/SA1388 family protein [Alicyclobacillus sacchari]GMA56123.1 GTP cyclohydrolase 1 type 2 [Alicyclobacillus sacchari]